MEAWAAELVIWLMGLGVLIIAAVLPLSRLIRADSTQFDEMYVWLKKPNHSNPMDKKS